MDGLNQCKKFSKNLTSFLNSALTVTPQDEGFVNFLQLHIFDQFHTTEMSKTLQSRDFLNLLKGLLYSWALGTANSQQLIGFYLVKKSLKSVAWWQRNKYLHLKQILGHPVFHHYFGLFVIVNQTFHFHFIPFILTLPKVTILVPQKTVNELPIGSSCTFCGATEYFST